MQELIKKLERQYGKPISEFTEFDWSCTSRYQLISEDFIREFQDEVDWEVIPIYQELSEDFIKEFQHKVYLNHILKYQTLSEKFIKKYKDYAKKKWYEFWKWFKKNK